MSEKRITISDIARESGASPTTVSLVLRDKGVIGSDTRERVLAAAQALGYERKPSRRMDGGDVTTAAILFRAQTPNPQSGALGVNPFYSWVLTGMEAIARIKRINLVYGTLSVNESNEIIDAPTHLLDQDLDGIVVVGAFNDDTIVSLLGTAGRPVVVVDGPGISSHFDVVASDNERGSRLATTHLIEAGHTGIAFLTRMQGNNPNFDARECGYRQTMFQHGLQPVVGRIEQWDVNDALDQILEEHPEVTAIVSVNDQFALDACKALERKDYRIPTELSVIGFDNTDHAVALSQGLTTMHVDKAGMGRMAITLLDYRVQWPESAPASIILSPSLITRGSVSHPRFTSASSAITALESNTGGFA